MPGTVVSGDAGRGRSLAGELDRVVEHVLAAHQAVVLRVDGFDRDVREQALDTVQFEANLRSEQDDGRVAFSSISEIG